MVFAMQTDNYSLGGGGLWRGVDSKQHRGVAKQAEIVATARENKFKNNNQPIAHKVNKG